MGILVNKDQPTDELSRRVAADLRQETAESADGSGDPNIVDFADNSEYIKDSKKTSRFGWVWAVLVVLAIGSIIVICMPGGL